MSDVSEETLLDYFSSTGGGSGRVKNADMLKTFKPFIGHADLQLRAKYREEFKLIIDRIAVVKSENGEKYLVLKKKYRQMLHERDAKHPGTDGDGQRHPSPARTPATVQWDTTDASTSSSSSPRHQKEQQDEREPDGAAEVSAVVHAVSTVTALQHPVVLVQEPSAQSNKEDDLDKDSGSKSESEQDEESTGSMGSAAVALDPLEKEWIYSAAGARVPDLSQLLRQDPSLANKKGYTPLHIAALHGHRHILDLLIGTYGAKENLRDYSGHLAFHYLNIKEPGEGLEEDCEILFQVTQARERNRNRKLVSLFHSKKKWGSAEELAPIEEERTASHQLILPAFRPRKFSR
ncbi:Ankyrin repeat domain-containing protein SOWAHB [Collichthys lucidus]|uniref:Ankyrin repeat domain-containing protein SOWAHB n=1 Tax=Collichthys lucidus TaxID=240159 RepID=A0A4U5UNS4_COLLU|nr:Ankyrin repeat domain-containing protein SOWAHB [Collichthys lucidus]